MDIELCSEAREFGVQAGRALSAAGGDELVQRAERDPGVRRTVVARVLGELGAWELAPRWDAVELEAAAALCRSAGYLALPYPVAERLAKPEEPEVDGLLVISDVRAAAAVADLELRWAAVTGTGARRNIAVRPDDSSPRAAMFVTGLDVGDPVEGGGDLDLALGLVLPCWTLLGMLDRAVELAREHVLLREQFGQPLAQFQGVQFQLTDAEVERRGVEMLARYALWSIGSGDSRMVVDALALRLGAIEAADTVFRVAHQLHGALGFCDESPLSWVSRYSQPIRQLPFGRSVTEELLGRAAGRGGFAGLFSVPMGV